MLGKILFHLCISISVMSALTAWAASSMAVSELGTGFVFLLKPGCLHGSAKYVMYV